MRRAALAAVAMIAALPAAAQQVPPIGSTPPAGAFAAHGTPPPGWPPTTPSATPPGAVPNTSAAAPGTGVPGVSPADAARPGVPDRMPPGLPALSPSARLSARDARAVGLATRWRLRSCGTTISADGVLAFAHGACEPTLVCAPFKVCNVALEPGEVPTDMPVIGDPRWQAVVRQGVDGGRRALHVAFKPGDAGLDSNFVLTTNQRVISLRLVSTRAQYMPLVRLSNPAFAQAQAWRVAQAQGFAAGLAGGTACDGAPVIPPAGFSIDAPHAARAWAPLQAYTVAGPAGARTCLDFPADLGSTDLPALVVLDATGAQQLTTARIVGRRMEVDAALVAAELVAGVGGAQVAVSIRRKGG